MNAEIKFKTNERNINCCSCGSRTADYYFTAQSMCTIGCGRGIENWCFRCEDDLRENETDKLVRNIQQVYICQGCNCDINDNGFCSEGCRFGEDDEDEYHIVSISTKEQSENDASANIYESEDEYDEAEKQLKADFAEEWAKMQTNKEMLDLLSKTFDKKNDFTQ